MHFILHMKILLARSVQAQFKNQCQLELWRTPAYDYTAKRNAHSADSLGRQNTRTILLIKLHFQRRHSFENKQPMNDDPIACRAPSKPFSKFNQWNEVFEMHSERRTNSGDDVNNDALLLVIFSPIAVCQFAVFFLSINNSMRRYRQTTDVTPDGITHAQS